MIASKNNRRQPLLGCIADDVTGATDLAINLVQGGMRVVQILGPADTDSLDQASQVDAVVIALKTRSIPSETAASLSLDALRSLQQLGATRFYFKYCSTFDSTARGNIGPVAEALMNELGASQTIFCPAFPRAGRTVYQGHLFVGDRLLHESGMENHPLNPMTDANLVRVLADQSTREVGLLSCDALTGDPQELAQRFESLADVPLVITDACHDDHLMALARGVVDLPLVTGGSGLARFLPRAYRAIGMLDETEFQPSIPEVSGRSLIVAGSCSLATQGQVQWMQQRCPTLHVNVPALLDDEDAEFERVKTWAASLGSDQPMLVASTSSPEAVSEIQGRFGAQRAASAVEAFLASVTNMMVDQLEVRRLVLAGGETSGAIAGALNIRWLRIGPEICTGVPWTETVAHGRRLALAFKSGNFGEEDFFHTALEMMP